MSTLSANFHPEFFDQKRPAIGGFFNDLCCWFTGAMTGSGFDPDQWRLVAALRGLKRSREFETVRGDDAIVVICGRDHGRGITAAPPRRGKVMKRRVGVEIREIVRFLGASVIRSPGPANGIFFES